MFISMLCYVIIKALYGKIGIKSKTLTYQLKNTQTVSPCAFIIVTR